MRRLIILFIIFLSYSACKKGEHEIYVSPDVKEYFNYKVGSYWIMRDSISGRIDSFVVTTNTLKVLPDDYNNGVDFIFVNIAQYVPGDLTDSCEWDLTLSQQNVSMSYHNIWRGETIGYYELYHTYPIAQTSPTFSLNGNDYKNVSYNLIGGNTYSPLGGDLLHYSRIAFNKENGIIKLSIEIIAHPHVWEVLRSKLVS